MRTLSTRNCTGRITEVAYLSPSKPPQKLSQLFASDWMCINAYVMALSRSVRYQFVCQTLVFPLFAGWFPVAPRGHAAVASRGGGKRLQSWTGASGPGVHRSTHLYKDVYKNTHPAEDRWLSVRPTNISCSLPEAKAFFFLPISDIKNRHRQCPAEEQWCIHWYHNTIMSSNKQIYFLKVLPFWILLA